MCLQGRLLKSLTYTCLNGDLSQSEDLTLSGACPADIGPCTRNRKELQKNGGKCTLSHLGMSCQTQNFTVLARVTSVDFVEGEVVSEGRSYLNTDLPFGVENLEKNEI